jgi:hypothetical protein
MKTSVLFRIAAVLLLFFALTHTWGFRQTDPSWGIDAVVGSMRSIHFDVQGSDRTYWDFFIGAGFSVGVFLLFTAVIAWQLGGLPDTTLAAVRGIPWTLALCLAVIAAVSWKFLFVVPAALAAIIAIVLAAAAWRSSAPRPR